MAISGIGIRQISPRSGTAWKERSEALERRRDGEREDSDSARSTVDAPAEPGVGQIVDRKV
jgi:hypothetical protein